MVMGPGPIRGVELFWGWLTREFGLATYSDWLPRSFGSGGAGWQGVELRPSCYMVHRM
jgi:hypothetical protein